MPRHNPYLFVVGCPRSGTTLLQRMLDHHPELTVTNDSHFIPRALKRKALSNPPLTDALVERVRTYRRFYRLGLSDDEVDRAAEHAPTYRHFVSNLYTAVAQRAGTPLAGEKTPDYGRHLPLLHALFPWARVLHIVRDGRDVALSTLAWAHELKGPGKWTLWHREPIATCALWWRWHVETARRDGRHLDDGLYHELRYEALVEAPGPTLRDAAAFLDLPFAPQMLEYHVGKTRHNPKLSAKSAWLPPVRGLRDWRSQLPERDVALFEALAGDVLTALGYERAFHSVSPHIARVAEACRRWWDTHRQAPHRPSPLAPVQ